MQQDNAYKKQYSVACRMAAADTGTHHVELFLNMKKNPVSTWAERQLPDH